VSDSTVAAQACEAIASAHQQFDAYPTRAVTLGQLAVVRALPVKGKRLIGPWCFLDRFGPATFAQGGRMDVAPHPHIGLQTVTWLLDGEIVHDDSLEQEALLRPGGVNIMTSGRDIAHAERTHHDNSGRLNGVQIWTALPDRDRHRLPSFQHLIDVPRLEQTGGIVQVFSGALAGATSPAEHFSPLVGADLQVHARHELTLPLERQHEHALLILSGECALEGQRLEERVLYYLGTQRSEMWLTSRSGARLLLIGGVPFPETILMWWNFVARTPEEIREARNDWEAHRTFGDVPAYKGARIPAPALVRLAPPNPVS
jgi:hypothetical protein